MASVFYNNELEAKKRPGVYQRHANVGFETPTGAQDGYCAIPIKASWGPLGKVLKNVTASDLEKNYGPGSYGTAHTVQAATAMFKGGASVVYTYRMGTGGKTATKEITTGLTATAKYPGTLAISIAVQEKLGATGVKRLMVYAGSSLVETWEFDADGKAEGANLVEAAKNSNYIVVSGTAATVPTIAAASGALTGGENPTVTNGDYSTAFAALEPYFYNCIALDVDDNETLDLSLMLQSYLDNAYALGKLAFAVVGEKTTVSFDDRCAHAKAFNDAKVIYLGGGYMAGSENLDGVMSICYAAGVIASTPSNKGITHTVIDGATDLCESLTYAQYEQAIDSGMLMVSMSPDGAIWYDSAINTLTSPDPATQDNGWKKIRRTKVRFEMIDRLDRALAPKVGKVSADSDGIADIVQTGQRILDQMAMSEGKLQIGAKFSVDGEHSYDGDSAWFIIQADDVDSLEKIYLQYQFRYSQKS